MCEYLEQCDGIPFKVACTDMGHYNYVAVSAVCAVPLKALHGV